MTGVESTLCGSELLATRPIIEQSKRWIRVRFNGEIVGDSKGTLLLRESAGRLAYYFPEEDVMMRFLEPDRKGNDGRRYFDVHTGDRSAGAAAWIYDDPPPELARLKGY